MWEMVIVQFKKLHGENEGGETYRLFIGKQLGVLVKAITDHTSGKMELKRKSVEMGEMEMGKGVDARNSRTVPKSASGNRIPNVGIIPGGKSKFR